MASDRLAAGVGAHIMKTFDDLTFDLKNGWGEPRAMLAFENGYGVSVITGRNSFTDEARPYEIMVLKNDKPITVDLFPDKILGWLTAERVTEVMAQIQALP